MLQPPGVSWFLRLFQRCTDLLEDGQEVEVLMQLQLVSPLFMSAWESVCVRLDDHSRQSEVSLPALREDSSELRRTLVSSAGRSSITSWPQEMVSVVQPFAFALS